jgi:hypothetical protein
LIIEATLAISATIEIFDCHTPFSPAPLAEAIDDTLLFIMMPPSPSHYATLRAMPLIRAMRLLMPTR